MKIAIVGSGISGLSFWIFLQKLGILEKHDVAIYEARPATDQDSANSSNPGTYEASVIGAGIGLSTNGLNVLKRWDEELFDEVTKTGHILKTCRITNARGWTLADATFGSEQQTTVMIGREAFWQILRRRVPEEAILRKKVSKIESSESTNLLRLSDGSSTEADLVVGADGIWSIVRRAIFGAPEGRSDYQYSPHYEGLIGVGGFVPASSLAHDPNGEMDIVFGANGFFGYAYADAIATSPDRHGSTAVWWSTYSLDECPEDWRKIDRRDAEKQLRDRHGSWKNQTVHNIIRDVTVDSVYPTFTTPLLPTWESGGLVLIGDAAHALQPSSAQGASMALEDCEALALFLDHHLANGKERSHLDAAKQYCELRKPRLDMVHKKAEEIGALKQDMGVVKEMTMYFFIWMINRFRLGERYNTTLFEYDGPAEVKRSIAEWKSQA